MAKAKEEHRCPVCVRWEMDSYILSEYDGGQESLDQKETYRRKNLS